MTVIDDVLGFLKLRRGRPDVTGARVAAIGRIQALLEAEQEEIKANLITEKEVAA